MKRKLIINKDKILKLSNVIIKKINVEKCESIDKEIKIMENYIRSKGAIPIGPIIQYTTMIVGEDNKMDIEIKLIRQSNKFLNHIENPYQIQPLLRVKNCMYVRFCGEEKDMKFAYDKINLTAYEEDIKLKGDSYTVFVDLKEDNIIADIFMECIDND